MRTRLADESGFGLVELMVAVMVLTIALLALAAVFEAAAVSVGKAAQKTSAATLADDQMELYDALPFGSIGLDATTLTAVKTVGNPSYSATYVSDETALNAAGSGSDVTISGCGSTAQCEPVQSLTGADDNTYTVETFIRDVTTFTIWSERIVTVIVRDPNESGSPEVLRLTTAFDKGPS